MIKIFPIWCNVNFVSVFIALNSTKKQRKFNIRPYGEIFYQLTYWDRKLHFLKVCYHLKILGWSYGFRAIDDLPCAQ